MELKRVTEKVFYIPNPASIGVVKNRETAILIDSGLDDDTGRKVLRLLKENGLSVKAIVNTHSHADHCGGNRYIKNKTGAKVYAPEIESAIIEYPMLEPLYFFSGASPLKELQNKFLMAQPCAVDHIIRRDEQNLVIEGVELGIVPLPGHALNQIGVEADNVLFCADAVFSENTLDKHKIPFFMDIDSTRDTLAFLKGSVYSFYVPSHAEPREFLAGLVDANLEAIEGVERLIMEKLAGMTTEQVLKGLCDHYRIEMRGAQQYYLMNTIVMAYLSSLGRRRKLGAGVKGNSLVWEKA